MTEYCNGIAKEKFLSERQLGALANNSRALHRNLKSSFHRYKSFIGRDLLAFSKKNRRLALTLGPNTELYSDAIITNCTDDIPCRQNTRLTVHLSPSNTNSINCNEYGFAKNNQKKVSLKNMPHTLFTIADGNAPNLT